ncbi:hypothetical protein Tco_1552096, partial [Tanacetum coccineum]
DDESDSSRDDTDDEDEDKEDEEDEEEHPAPADSAVVIPTVELVSPPKGTEPAFISLPPEAEVERLIAIPTPPPSPPISLSPPSAGERLVSLYSGLVDAVTAALPSPPLPPLPPSLYIPPPIDRSRYEVRESSTARPTGGLGVDYGFVITLDAEERRQGIREVGYGIRDTWVDPAEAVPEIALITVGEVNTRVTKLAELYEHDTHDLYALLEDAQDSICTRVPAPCTSDIATVAGRQAQIVETLCVMRDMRQEMGDMHAELLALREQQRRARQPGTDVRVPDHEDASKDVDSHI